MQRDHGGSSGRRVRHGESVDLHACINAGVLGRLALDWSPLRTSPSFRRLWLAQSASFIGSEIGLVTVSYQVYALTKSNLDVGLLSLAQLVPLLTLTVLGGAFADAFDRRRLMLYQQAGMIVGTAFTVVN